MDHGERSGVPAVVKQSSQASWISNIASSYPKPIPEPGYEMWTIKKGKDGRMYYQNNDRGRRKDPRRKQSVAP
jgi:hypothetical protein